MRLGEYERAAVMLRGVGTGGDEGYPGLSLKVTQARCLLAMLANDPDADRLATVLVEAAEHQAASGYSRVGLLLLALRRGDAVQVDHLVDSMLKQDPALVSTVAEVVISNLVLLREETRDELVREVSRRPGRWLPSLRRCALAGPDRVRLASARVIELVGERADVALLRAVSRDLRGAVREPTLGRTLARRVADRVFVEDLGRVVLQLGTRVVTGTGLRRKVLALLCFLLAQPGLAATRDRVMEALWPESDPEQALNSLHQTAYFLRRSLEQDYVEDLSPGYVHHEGDVVWLDSELVDSRSRRCTTLLRSLGEIPLPNDIDRLAAEYRARFALDFTYEDWAASHRDSLHARYLETMERAMTDEVDAGHLDRAVRIAQRILDVDPDAEQVEVALLRLYRATGAHAAAAEQYAHYATVMREQLGVEPPPLEEL